MQSAVRWIALGIVLMCGAAWGQSPPASTATVEVDGRKTTLKNVVAFRAEGDEATRLVVVATMQRLSPEVFKRIEAKDAEESLDSELSQAYLKVVYSESGEPQVCQAHLGNSFFSTPLETSQGRATLDGNRARGELSLAEEGDFAKRVSLAFDVALGAPPRVALEAPIRPSVSGSFSGNGQPAKIRYVSAHPHEDFSDKKAVTLVFSEKDHSRDAKPWIKASFGDYGSALVLNVFEDGGIFGCQVAHQAHEKSGFTALGQIAMAEFDASTGNLRGQVTTPGEIDTFDEKWSVDLRFEAPLPPAVRKHWFEASAPAKATPRETKPASEAPRKESETPSKKSKPTRTAASFPIPKNAEKVEFKALVEQIHFQCPTPVKTLAQDLSAALARQGWKDGSGGVIGPRNAILSKEQGEAKLTIMLKLAGKGSQVVVFTENLNWDGAPKSKSPPDDDLEIEIDLPDGLGDEVQKAIDDALKGIGDE